MSADVDAQAVDELGRAVAKVLEIGIGKHPHRAELMAMLDAGKVHLRVVVEIQAEMTVQALAVRAADGQPVEIFTVGPGRGRPN